MLLGLFFHSKWFPHSKYLLHSINYWRGLWIRTYDNEFVHCNDQPCSPRSRARIRLSTTSTTGTWSTSETCLFENLTSTDQTSTEQTGSYRFYGIQHHSKEQTLIRYHYSAIPSANFERFIQFTDDKNDEQSTLLWFNTWSKGRGNWIIEQSISDKTQWTFERQNERKTKYSSAELFTSIHHGWWSKTELHDQIVLLSE